MNERYLKYIKGKGYFYAPPKDALDAGLFNGVKRSLGHDPVSANKAAASFNKMLDNWRGKGKKLAIKATHTRKDSFHSLCEKYKASHFYSRLSGETQEQYRTVIQNICSTNMKMGRCFGDYMLHEIDRQLAYDLYHTIKTTRGRAAAHYAVRVAKRLFSLALNEWEMVYRNPFEKLDIDPMQRRTVRWSHNELKLFTTAAAEQGYPSVGLIVETCYELMQRHKDVRELTKRNLVKTQEGFEVWLKQTKTGQEVWLPVSDDLAGKINNNLQSDNMFLFPCENTGKPWSRNRFAIRVKKIKDALGLPNDLFAMDLRRTAATEAGEAGATEDELMALGGWRSRQVVSVYVQKTRQAAINAQQKRWKNRK